MPMVVIQVPFQRRGASILFLALLVLGGQARRFQLPFHPEAGHLDSSLQTNLKEVRSAFDVDGIEGVVDGSVFEDDDSAGGGESGGQPVPASSTKGSAQAGLSSGIGDDGSSNASTVFSGCTTDGSPEDVGCHCASELSAVASLKDCDPRDLPKCLGLLPAAEKSEDCWQSIARNEKWINAGPLDHQSKPAGAAAASRVAGHAQPEPELVQFAASGGSPSDRIMEYSVGSGTMTSGVPDCTDDGSSDDVRCHCAGELTDLASQNACDPGAINPDALWKCIALISAQDRSEECASSVERHTQGAGQGETRLARGPGFSGSGGTGDSCVTDGTEEDVNCNCAGELTMVAGQNGCSPQSGEQNAFHKCLQLIPLELRSVDCRASVARHEPALGTWSDSAQLF